MTELTKEQIEHFAKEIGYFVGRLTGLALSLRFGDSKAVPRLQQEIRGVAELLGEAVAEPMEKRNARAGYCKLCREKELEMYGTLVDAGARHTAAVKAAGCWHPADYPVKDCQERTKG
jgi:hypothetical protein